MIWELETVETVEMEWAVMWRLWSELGPIAALRARAWDGAATKGPMTTVGKLQQNGPG